MEPLGYVSSFGIIARFLCACCQQAHRVQLCEGHTYFPDSTNSIVSCYYGSHNQYTDFQRRIYRRTGRMKAESYTLLHYLDSTGVYTSIASHMAALQMQQSEQGAAAEVLPSPAPAPPAAVVPASPQPAKLLLPPLEAQSGAVNAPPQLPTTAAIFMQPTDSGVHVSAGPPSFIEYPPPEGHQARSLVGLVDAIVQLAATSGASRTAAGQSAPSTGSTTPDLLALLQGGEGGGDEPSDSLLHHIASYGHPALVSKLLAIGCPVDAVGQWGYTPLLTAAHWGHGRTAAVLVRAGADVNATDEAHRNAAQIAEMRGHEALADAFRRCLLVGAAGGSAAAGSSAAAASPAKRSKHAEHSPAREHLLRHEDVLLHLEELSLGEGGGGVDDPPPATPSTPAASAMQRDAAAELLHAAGLYSPPTDVPVELAEQLQASLGSALPELAARSRGGSSVLAGGVPVQELLASLARAPLHERVALHMALPFNPKGSEGGSTRPQGGVFSSNHSDGGTSAEGFSLGGGLSIAGTEGGHAAVAGGYSPQASLLDASAYAAAAANQEDSALHTGVRLSRVCSVGSAAQFGLGVGGGTGAGVDQWGDSASVSANSRCGSVFEDVGVSDDEVLGAVEHPPSRPLEGASSSSSAQGHSQWASRFNAEVTRSASVSSDSRSSVSSSTTGGAGGGLSRADALRTFSCMNEQEQAQVEEEVALIQRNVRAWLMLRNYRSLKGAVRSLQAAVRRSMEERRTQVQHAAAHKLQGVFRAAVRDRRPIPVEGCVDSAAALALRQARAALVIQGTLRSRLPRMAAAGGYEGGVGGAVHPPPAADAGAGCSPGAVTGGRKRERNA